MRLFVQLRPTECANKKQSHKNTAIRPRWYGFEQNFQILYENIHATYRANFIEIAGMVRHIQHFKL